MNLFKASRQWAERPADERFSSIKELDEVCSGYRAQARTSQIPYEKLTVVANDDEVVVEGTTQQAKLTHWAFGQLCSRASAPASYLRGIPATLAAECLRHGLKDHGGEAQLMFHQNGELVARSITSERYDRIWNADITKRLVALVEDGWRLPPARPARPGQPGTRIATIDDVLPAEMAGTHGLSVKVGDLIAPAGAYASDHDMFVFLIDPTRPICDPMGDVLWRGFFAWNSEVGAASFGIETFRFKSVCGNHIVWGAKDSKQMRIRHVGDANERSAQILAEVYKYREGSAQDEEAQLVLAERKILGANKEEVLDALFKMRLPVSKTQVVSAVEIAEENAETDGNPRSVYGVVNGFTRLSQQTNYADERVAIDRAAGKVMDIAF